MNGNIKCFGSEHAGLGLSAIVILTLSVAAIPLSLAYNMDWLKVSTRIVFVTSSFVILCSVHGF